MSGMRFANHRSVYYKFQFINSIQVLTVLQRWESELFLEIFFRYPINRGPKMFSEALRANLAVRIVS